MVYSIVHKSKLEGSQRLDAEYYQPEYLKFSKKLQLIKTVRLGDIAYITDGEHGSPIWDESSGIKYFSAQHVKDGVIDNSNVQTISKIIDDKNKRSRLKEGDVLLSTVGTIGFAGIITKDLLPANIDRHVGRISLTKDTLTPEFLVAFLNSSYGRFQTIRQATGNVQLNLFIEKIKDLRIPIANNSRVSKLMKDAMRELDKSENFYYQAENLLLEELGLKDFQLSNDLTFEVNFSEVEKTKRLDADYFQPKYELLVNKLGLKKKLSEFVRRVKTSFKIEPDKQYNYIEIGDVNVGSGKVSFNKVLGKELPVNAKIKVGGGELIVSKVRPTRGAIAIVPGKFNENFIVSGAFSVFNVDSPTKEYLQVILRSIIGKLQLEKPTTGTSYPTVTDEDVENLWIPDLSKLIQQKIADLVRQSHDARRKSKALLEQAKREVEEMIEKTP